MAGFAPKTQGSGLTAFERLRYAREVIDGAAKALTDLAKRLDRSFCDAVELVASCPGTIVVSGVGKAGLIGQKLVATFNSLGRRSVFLHPAEAFHGDLGCVREGDVALLLSFSGETEEIVRLAPALVDLGASVVAMTGKPESSLARTATVTLDLGPMREACWMGLAPSTSTSAMLAMGDALALVAARQAGFEPRDFLRFHPGGNLGRKLTQVEQAMRPLADCRVAPASQSVRDAMKLVGRTGRRVGAVMLVDGDGRLAGLFTDSDLARLIESGREDALGLPIAGVMTRSPRLVQVGQSLADAWDILTNRKLSELPVVDPRGRPVGMIDITDLASAGDRAARGSERKG